MIRTYTQRPAISGRVHVMGFVLAALLAASMMLVASEPAHADLTFTVNSTSDTGSGGCNSSECTLREAIALANRVSGADTINFNINDDTNAVKTISLSSELPRITEAVTIDGYTQPGTAENTLDHGATNAVLKIELDGNGAGSANGLAILADHVAVRGLAIGNFDRTGILIGANNPSDGLIEPSGVEIEGNFIGTDASGTMLRSNGFSGVSSGTDGESNTIGGTTPEARNLISGNSSGINISGSKGGYAIKGNLIGTSKGGTDGGMGNRNEGVRLASPGNTVGGAGTSAANTIAFNGDPGVEVANLDTAIGNRILGNSVFSNDELGIDLEGGNEDAGGRTANDKKDPDRGANALQNKPVLTFAKVDDGTTIEGTLESAPSTKKKKTFTIQFFSNPQNEDEGKTFLGQKTVHTNRRGKASFTFVSRASAANNVTATATDSRGNTSEFSDPEGVARL